MLLALLLTALNYAVLTGYDQLAFAWVGRRLHRGWIALAGFVSYAISNSLGFGMLSGAAVRFRFYTRWGVSAVELSKIVLFQTTTFWLGLLVLGGCDDRPHAAPLAARAARRPAAARPRPRDAGARRRLRAAAPARKAPLRIGRLELPVPGPRLAAGQFVLSILDWSARRRGPATSCCRPPGAVRRAARRLPRGAGRRPVSHVPGGLGVFETLMVLALKPYLPASAVLPALVLYRVVYYAAAAGRCALALLLVADEARERRAQIARLGGVFGTLSTRRSPRACSRRSPSRPGRCCCSRARRRRCTGRVAGCRPCCPCRSSRLATSSAA